MEDLITLIAIIVISLVSVIGKMKSKAASTRKKAKPQGVAGWLAKLNAYVEEVQKSSRPRVEESDDDIGAAQWRSLMEKETASIPPGHDRDEDLGDLEFVEVPEPPQVKPASAAARARAGLPPREQPKPEAKPPQTAVRRTRRTALPGSLTDLRRAIVWSEILGPPVAMKEPFNR